MQYKAIIKIFNEMKAITGIEARLLSFKSQAYYLLEDNFNDVFGCCTWIGEQLIIFLNRRLIENHYWKKKNESIYRIEINEEWALSATTLKGFYELVIIHELTHAQNRHNGIVDYMHETREHLPIFYQRYRENLLKLVYKRAEELK